MCYDNIDCSPGLPLCGTILSVVPGQPISVCVGCVHDSDCALFPGTLCYHQSHNNFAPGACGPPECLASEDCPSPSNPQCISGGLYNATCAGCSTETDCVPFPSRPYCGLNSECQAGCNSDGNCDSGYYCFDGTCVECFTSYQCFSKDESTPICAANNTCVMCTQDSDCLGQVILFEACHTEWRDVGGTSVQVVGRCVQDTYRKGFQITAMVIAVLAFLAVLVVIGLTLKSLQSSDEGFQKH